MSALSIPALRRLIAPRPDPAAPAPLSFAQERIWFLAQLDPQAVNYTIPASFRLQGALRFDALERSLRTVIARHEPLRTVYRLVDHKPVQCVLPEQPVPLVLADLSGVPESVRDAELRRAVDSVLALSFNLESGPILRVCLFRLAPRDHSGLLAVHHIAADAASMYLLAGELAACYHAFEEGSPSPLHPLPLQYADYAAWQRETFDRGYLQTHVDYWKKQLAPPLPACGLLPDFLSLEAAPRNASRRAIEIPAPLIKALSALARHHDATLFTVLLAAFNVLLHRYTGQTDLVIGFDCADRDRAEVEGLIGIFVNTLLLRADLSGRPAFSEALRRVRNLLLEAYAHRDLPFDKLVEELQPERNSSHQPLFQIGFSLQRSTKGPKRAGSSAIAGADAPALAPKFQLAMNLIELPQLVAGTIEYDARLYTPEVIRRLGRDYLRLLKSVVADPARPIGALPLLNAVDRREAVLHGAPAEPYQSFSRAFGHQAALRPNSPAVDDGEIAWTYRELHARAVSAAERLIARGAGPEHIVAILAPRSSAYLAAFVGCLMSGAAFLPLDPDAPSARNIAVLGTAKPSVIVASPEFAPLLKQAGFVSRLAPLAELVEPEDSSLGLPELDPRSLAYVIFTSGSTGAPKGVMIEHRGMMNHLRAKIGEFAVAPADIIAQTAVQSFDISIWQFLAPLIAGACVRLVKADRSRDPGRLLAEVRGSGVTILEAAPVMLRMLLDAVERDPAARRSPLRWLLVTGEELPVALVKRWFDQFPAIPLVNAYGPTECSDDVTHCILRQPLAANAIRTPIGSPLAGVCLVAIDNLLEPVPAPVAGHLHSGGVCVGRGYLGDPARTAEAFIPDPFSAEPGARLYRTGDLARRSGRSLEYLGRIDRQVKLRGFRIELGEIEAALTRLPGVRQALLIAGEALAAYVVAEPGVSGDDLRESLRHFLPSYMVPSAIALLPEFPLLPSGKIDLQALPPPRVSRALDSLRSPVGLVEEMLASIWSQVLGLPDVGLDEDFFRLGGHSLLATQVVSRVRDAFGVEIPLRHVFEFRTIRRLAPELNALRNTGRCTSLPPLVPAGLGGSSPLSFSQRRFWFLDRFHPGDSANNIPGSFAIQGHIDVAVLTKCIQGIVDRHDILRAAFVVEAGEPRQVVAPALEAHLPIIDLQAVGAPSIEREWVRLAAEEASTPFRLDRPGQFRARLLRCAPDMHRLLFSLHHIVADGWSIDLLIGELGARYRAHTEGPQEPFERLPLQYADYATWQQQAFATENLEQDLEYWREQLKGAPPVLRLPTDRPRSARRSSRGGTISFELPEDVVRAARTLSHSEGVTVYMTLLAGFQTLLYRLTGETDLVVGTDVSGRTRAETEPLIGVFVNQLALRVSLAGNPEFRDLLRRVREVSLGAFVRQDVPFDRVVEAVDPPRSLSHTPLFQVSFQFQNAQSREIRQSGLTLLPVGVARQVSKFDLAVLLEDDGSSIRGSLVYNSDLFDPETVQLWAESYRTLLAAAVAAPESRVGALPVMELSEREPPLALAAPEPKTVAPLNRLFEERARTRPDSVALVFDGGQIGTADLDRRANRMARHLVDCGAGPEVPIGVLIDRSPDCIVSLLAIWKSGAAYVPIDPRWNDARILSVSGRAGIRVLAGHWRLVRRFEKSFSQLVCWDKIQSDLARRSGCPLAATPDPDSAAYIIHTSGSTAIPKGVVVPHRALSHFAASFGQAVDWSHVRRFGRFALNASLAFDASFQAIVRLAAGYTLVLIPEEIRQDPRALVQYLNLQNVDIFDCTPSQLSVLLAENLIAPGARSPRILLLGGEPVPPAVWKTLSEAPGIAAYNVYGPTECVVNALASRIEGRDQTLGHPLAGVTALVADRALEPAPIGADGELCLGGNALARGYLGQPDETALRFVPNPHSTVPGSRLYRTGDIVRRSGSGPLSYVGRADEQVKIRGIRIELGEIEATLCSHPDVVGSAMTAPQAPDGSRFLAAWYTARDGAYLASSDLSAHVRGLLPDYMVPSVFTRLDCMPVTPAGKLDRNALAALEIAPACVPETTDPTLSQIEELVAGVWCEHLRVPRIAADGNFFDLGGHSLLAMRVISRIRALCDVEVPLQDLFESPTLAGFAAAVDRALRSGPRGPAPTPRASRRAALSYAQQRIWFLSRLDPDSNTLHISGASRLRGLLRVDALSRALACLTRRHESLRTRFVVVAGDPVQIVDPPGNPDFGVIDLSAIDPPERGIEGRRVCQDVTRRTFRLEDGNLLRVRVLRLGAEEHAVVYALHHIVADAWSMRVLLRELGTCYQAYAAGREPALPALPIQYADYAIWQREFLATKAAGHLDYWKRQLAGAPPALDLPSRGGAGDGAATLAFEFPLELTQSLVNLGRREGATLFMILLAGFAVVLDRFSGRRDVVIGTDLAGRNRAETEGLIGLFINQLPLRIDLSGDPAFRELLGRVRATCLGAYSHQDTPFDWIVGAVAPERTGRTPLFQVLFDFRQGMESLSEAGFDAEPLETGPPAAQFDLMLVAHERRGRIQGSFEYSRQRFVEPDIAAMRDAWQSLLNAGTANPAAPLVELSPEGTEAAQAFLESLGAPL